MSTWRTKGNVSTIEKLLNVNEFVLCKEKHNDSDANRDDDINNECTDDFDDMDMDDNNTVSTEENSGHVSWLNWLKRVRLSTDMVVALVTKLHSAKNKRQARHTSRMFTHNETISKCNCA